jgi:hypothetical protein
MAPRRPPIRPGGRRSSWSFIVVNCSSPTIYVTKPVHRSDWPREGCSRRSPGRLGGDFDPQARMGSAPAPPTSQVRPPHLPARRHTCAFRALRLTRRFHASQGVTAGTSGTPCSLVLRLGSGRARSRRPAGRPSLRRPTTGVVVWLVCGMRAKRRKGSRSGAVRTVLAGGSRRNL